MSGIWDLQDHLKNWPLRVGKRRKIGLSLVSQRRLCGLVCACARVCVCVCVCEIQARYLEESWRYGSHWHALSWGHVPDDGAGSCSSTLRTTTQQQPHQSGTVTL